MCSDHCLCWFTKQIDELQFGFVRHFRIGWRVLCYLLRRWNLQRVGDRLFLLRCGRRLICGCSEDEEDEEELDGSEAKKLEEDDELLALQDDVHMDDDE